MTAVLAIATPTTTAIRSEPTTNTSFLLSFCAMAFSPIHRSVRVTGPASYSVVFSRDAIASPFPSCFPASCFGS